MPVPLVVIWDLVIESTYQPAVYEAVIESVCVCAVQDIVFQLQRLVTAMAKYHNECHAVLKDAEVFPIEVDLSRSTFTYDTAGQYNDVTGDDDDDDDVTDAAADTGVLTPADTDSDTRHTVTDDVNLISTD